MVPSRLMLTLWLLQISNNTEKTWSKHDFLCCSTHTCPARYSTGAGLMLWWEGHREMSEQGRTSLHRSSCPELARWLQMASPALTPAGPQRQGKQWNNWSWFSCKTDNKMNSFNEASSTSRQRIQLVVGSKLLHHIYVERSSLTDFPLYTYIVMPSLFLFFTPKQPVSPV